MTKQQKKQLDDTDLEWYGLTEEDIEKMKEEGDFIDGDIMIDALKLSGIFYKAGYNVELDDIINLLKKSKKNEKIQVNV